MSIAEDLSRKGADIDAIAAGFIDRREPLEEVIEGVTAPSGTLRYGYEKVLREISRQRPELVYPYFDDVVQLMDHENSFLKWGAILTVGHLAKADRERRFEKIFKRYYAPISGPVMVTAANVIGASVEIVQARPELADRVATQILKVEDAEYERKGAPSPECRNVAIGGAIDAFEQIFDQLGRKRTAVVKFAQRQLENSRAKVVTKAEKFLRQHATRR